MKLKPSIRLAVLRHKLRRFILHPLWHYDVRTIIRLVELDWDREDRLIVDALNLLRAGEGNSVTFVCDNPEPDNDRELVYIECLGDFTDWRPLTFHGRNLPSCLRAAMKYQNNWQIREALNRNQQTTSES